MHFVVTRASEAPELARALAEGQRAAMRPYGIDSIVRSEVDPDAYLLVAVLASSAIGGGLRLEQRTADHALPLERAIALPAGALRKLERRAVEGLVEVCGLWVGSPPAEPHLAERLVRLSLAVATAMGARHAVAFGGQHSLPLALRCGFHFEGGEPVFPYPDPRYRSRIVWRRLQPLS